MSIAVEVFANFDFVWISSLVSYYMVVKMQIVYVRCG